MASPPPNHKCLICGAPLQYKAVQRANPQRLMRPTTYEQLPHECPPGARLHFSNKWLREKIAGDPDVECEAGQPLEGRPMTISIQVSVNGNYKVPVTVKRGAEEATTEIVSGRGHPGPNVKHIPYYHGSDGDVVVTVGKEEQDNG